MRVLITGGAGFIGTNYVYAHLRRRPEDSLTVLDALTYSGHRENLAEAEGHGVKFVHGRIEDKKSIFELFEAEKFDLVVHFAAETHVDHSIKEPSVFVSTNVAGTQTLLDAAREFGVKRFHHISTDEVYGDLGFANGENSDVKFTEDSPIRPSSPYSASKAASDFMVMAYHRTYGLPVTISRCSNNFGPYQSLENLIPLLIACASKGEKLPIYGTGKNVRDWLFVEDHCNAILEILEKGKIGQIYNIGGGNSLENLEVAKVILDLIGAPETLIDFVPDRKGHDERYAVDYSRLNSETGWEPKTSFKEGILKTVEWYKMGLYERSHTSGRHGNAPTTAHQSHKQTLIADL